MKERLIILMRKIFSFKVFLIIVLVGLSYWNILSIYKIKTLMDEKSFIQSQYRESSYLTKVTSGMEGDRIDNIELKNISGNIKFDYLFKNKGYIIVIYQNELVCSPCLEFVMGYWIKNKKQFNSNLSQDLIIINNIANSSTIRYLSSVHAENAFYIDSKNYIHDNIIKIDKPTNFIFFINKNRQLIFSTYFSTESKDNLIDLLKNANRFLDNNSL